MKLKYAVLTATIILLSVILLIPVSADKVSEIIYIIDSENGEKPDITEDREAWFADSHNEAKSSVGAQTTDKPTDFPVGLSVV